MLQSHTLGDVEERSDQTDHETAQRPGQKLTEDPLSVAVLTRAVTCSITSGQQQELTLSI